MATPETQFSIYKIDYDLVEEKFNINISRTANNYTTAITSVLVNSIVAILKTKSSSYYRFDNNGFVGVVFKTIHKPAWKDVAEQLLSNENLDSKTKESLLNNTNVSYVFIYEIKGNLYACTGGYGSNYISKFVVKNFGLYLLPKMIDPDNQVIKNVIQNNLIGNQTSTNKVNRNSTSVSNEQDMSSIFRQLIVEANREIAESLGVVFDSEEPSSKKTSIINKDSLVIRRNFTLAELVSILEKINVLEEKADAFALNYMVLARKKGLKNSELKEKLIQDFMADDFSRFILIGDDYEQYYVSATRYLLTDKESQTVLLDKNEPLLIQDIVNLTKNKNGKNTKTEINNMLKHWEISTYDDNGNPILYPIPIFDAIQGFIEFGTNNLPCYLFNSNWYVFDNRYESMLNLEFGRFYDANHKISSDLIARWNLKSDSKNEETYNLKLSKREDIIVSHKALLGNIEIADVVFWENDTVYFMHNKMTFNGTGSRDLTNQILAAAEYFQIKRMSMERNAFFREYYKKIEQIANKNSRCLAFDEKEFVEKLDTAKHFCFIAGYLCNYRRDSRATYAKYLSIELKKKLMAKGFDCCVMGLD